MIHKHLSRLRLRSGTWSQERRCCWLSPCCYGKRFAVLRVGECGRRAPDGQASTIGKQHDDIHLKSVTDAYGSRSFLAPYRARL